jgi:hypothetical protein
MQTAIQNVIKTFYLNSIVMVPLLFWVIQSFGAFVRYNLYEGVQENASYILEFLKSIGFNFCCIALAIDFGLLSQYKEEIFKNSPNFVFIMLIHLLAWIFSIGDQILYKWISSKITNSISYNKKGLWGTLNIVVFLILLFVGIWCLYSISKIVNPKIINEVAK